MGLLDNLSGNTALQEKLDRERQKREAAEALLEEKSLELYRVNLTLADKINEVEAANEEVRTLNDSLSEINDKLQLAFADAKRHREIAEDHNQDILDSIRYARRIQQAILPSRESIAAHFADICLLYLPKDIVSGDFYWIYTRGPQILLAAVDCTGHGVPGAFMSVLGNNLLTQIAQAATDLNPARLLDTLDAEVRRVLKQDETALGALDGMDISLLLVDTDKRVMYLSMAGHKAYLCQQKQSWEVIAGDKASVGGRKQTETHFTLHTVPYQPGDRIFLHSDGITDQFGVGNKKYLPKRFFSFLEQRADRPMAELENSLRLELDAWRGHLAQTDDVLVIGVELR